MSAVCRRRCGGCQNFYILRILTPYIPWWRQPWWQSACFFFLSPPYLTSYKFSRPTHSHTLHTLMQAGLMADCLLFFPLNLTPYKFSHPTNSHSTYLDAGSLDGRLPAFLSSQPHTLQILMPYKFSHPTYLDAGRLDGRRLQPARQR